MAAMIKSLNFKQAMLVLVFLALLLLQTQVIKSQTDETCSENLANVNTCAHRLPGAANDVPSQECCAALKAVDHGCVCNSIQIASRLASKCNLPPLICNAGN